MKADLERMLTFEADPANRIIVAKSLAAPCPQVASTIRAIETRLKELEQSRAKWQKVQKARTLDEMFSEANGSEDWSRYVERGSRLDHLANALPIRISAESCDRGLRIWDSLVKTSSGRRFKFDLNGVLSIPALDAKVAVRMYEKLAPAKGVPEWASESDIRLGRLPDKEPSGNLVLVIGCPPHAKQLDDRPGQPIESRLNDAFKLAFRYLQGENARAEREVHIQALRYAAELETAAKAVKARALREQQEQGLEKVRLLQQEASQWSEAESLRRYVAHVIRSAKPGSLAKSTALEEWAQWTHEVANRLDPTRRRLQSIQEGETTPSTVARDTL